MTAESQQATRTDIVSKDQLVADMGQQGIMLISDDLPQLGLAENVDSNGLAAYDIVIERKTSRIDPSFELFKKSLGVPTFGQFIQESKKTASRPS
jgi:hypothetical protein